MRRDAAYSSGKTCLSLSIQWQNTETEIIRERDTNVSCVLSNEIPNI